MKEPAARGQADALAAGEIVVIPFNGIFVLVGDADHPAVAEKIASAKQRPQAKGIRSSARPSSWPSTSCSRALCQRGRMLPQVQALYGAVHAVGVILPAARPGAPPHIVQAGTVLNV